MLAAAGKKALRRKATIDWQQIGVDATKYLGDESVTEWRTRFHPVITGTVIDQEAAISKAMIGASFNVPNLLGQKWFEDYELQFAQQVNDTTNTDIRQLLQTAMAEGLSVPDTQKRLDALFEQYGTGNGDPALLEWMKPRMALHRTEAIVRTETMRASNMGLYQIYQGWDMRLKTWLAAHDPRTRVDHLKAGGAYAEGGDPGPIPFDQPFIVGGNKMMMPHDSSAPVEQTVNCRCTVAPIVGDEDVERLREQARAQAVEPYSDATLIQYPELAAQEAEWRKVHLPIERGCGIDADGKVTLFEGTETYVNASLEPYANGVFSHSHPDIATLSYSDIEQAASCNLAEIRAVDTKTVYSMKRPPNGWDRRWYRQQEAAWMLDRQYDLQDALVPLRRSGDITLNELKNRVADQVWRELAERTGATYTATPYTKGT